MFSPASSYETACSDEEAPLAHSITNERIALALHFQPDTPRLDDTLWPALFAQNSDALPTSLACFAASALLPLAHHFPEQWVTRDTHKPSALLQHVALRAHDLCGGELTLHSTSDTEYALVLSDGYLRWPGDEPVQCSIALPRDAQCTRVTLRALDLSRFLRPGELCVVRSRGTLNVRFGARSRCVLYTPGHLRLELERGVLAFWCASQPALFPLLWQVDSTPMTMHRDFAGASLLSGAQRVAALRRLFDQGDERCDVGLDSTGAPVFLAHCDRACGRGWLREHGTFGSDYAKERALMRSIQVLNRGGMWPEFYQGRGAKRRQLSVMRHRYRGYDEVVAARWDDEDTPEPPPTHQYYVNALYSGQRDNLVAYFYLNLDANRLLFVPLH